MTLYQYPDTVEIAGVEKADALEVALDSDRNNNADVMAVYTGTILMGFRGESSSAWRRGMFRLRVPTAGVGPNGEVIAGRQWTPHIDRGPGWTVLYKGVGMASLASVYNKNVANNAGWAVDAVVVEARASQPGANLTDRLVLDDYLAVRDSDGILYRVAYQVTAIGRTIAEASGYVVGARPDPRV